MRIGYDLVSRIAFLAAAAEIVRTHQEHYDGSGYPQGLVGEEIPLGGRIFAVADTLDAMTSDRPYRRLLEAAKDGILILDADTGEITDVNPFLADLLEFSHAELRGKKLWEIGPLKNAILSKASFADLQSNGYIRYEHLPLETRNGRRTEVEFVSNVYLVNHQKVIQCNIRDITQRQRAEEALRRSEASYRSLIQGATYGIFRCPVDGKFLTVNPALVAMLGYGSASDG